MEYRAKLVHHLISVLLNNNKKFNTISGVNTNKIIDIMEMKLFISKLMIEFVPSVGKNQ